MNEMNWNLNVGNIRGVLGEVGSIGVSNGKRGILGVTIPPNGFARELGGCGIAGFFNVDGKREDGTKISDMMNNMLDRENGLGAGYACYGLFPEFEDYYCIQLLLDDDHVRQNVEEYLKSVVTIVKDEKVYTNPVKSMRKPFPLIWRFFIDVVNDKKDDFVVNVVMHINTKIDGAFCMSSGKNMAVFKGNGWSDEIAEYYDIKRYRGYLWMGHSRFPTNTPGWWGGAHPFNILGWSVCHNGEITSYGTNKRYVEMWDYKCTLLTDSEVVTYIIDLLCRKHSLPILVGAMVMAPSYYKEIDLLPPEKRMFMYALRRTYGSAMINGPFSIVVGSTFQGATLIGLTDRKKLRPMVAGVSDDGNTVYISSENCAISRVDNIKTVWAPVAGNPIVAQLNKGLVWDGTRNILNTKEVRF